MLASASAQGNWPGLARPGGLAGRPRFWPTDAGRPAARELTQPLLPGPQLGTGSPGSRRPGDIGHRERALVHQDGCTRGADDCLLARLISRGVPRADAPTQEASMEMAGKLAPSRQSGHISSGATVGYQMARIGSRPSGLPHTRLGGRVAASWCCLADAIAIAGWSAGDA